MEFDLGEAESCESGSDYEVQLRRWRENALKRCQESEYGIQSYYYTNYAQIAAKAKDYQQLRRFLTRLRGNRERYRREYSILCRETSATSGVRSTKKILGVCWRGSRLLIQNSRCRRFSCKTPLTPKLLRTGIYPADGIERSILNTFTF